MSQRAGRLASIGSAAALATALASPAMAQSVNDYRLPGTTTTAPNPRAQGPVDAEAPVVRPTPQPTATPSATPTISPAPVVATPAPAATSRPAPATSQPAPQPAPRAAAPTLRTSQPVPGASGAAVALPPLATPAATGSPGIDTVVPPAAPAASVPSASDDSAGPWPWIAGLLAIVAAIFALMWWRRGRDEREPEITFEPPVVRTAPASTGPVPEPTVDPAAEPRPAAPVVPQPPLDRSGLEIALEATRMSASLLATTLNYRLVVTNRGTQVLSGLAVEGDMVSAHSSLPAEQQVATDAHTLEARHALVELAPGESAEFTGDFRLPLTAVTPIRSGQAAFFVPLARLRVRARTPGGNPLVSAQTFVVGELPEQPGAALRPFRLDLGPRTYSRIGQRAVT
ncbi:hypothetical protein B0I00_1836 [Novosphingobium kunmingense]|uniref:Uncharacterized protein n=1 Tax=Novosphingobium kunmingense TaxID=1211806 RepID=A0A2N0HL16_9SPHN|nr:hypothetical protein [Novosphingobium kunmingense]PKB19599.1 hypothetical protein B0I00_1836 [Novosphingobium kunmingense]